MSQDKRTYYFELVDVVKFLIKYKKPLSIISIGAGIAAIIFSSPWFIKPLYKSTAIFYPSTNNSISSALLSDTRIKSKDPLEFGEQATAQQFIQMLDTQDLEDVDRGFAFYKRNILQSVFSSWLTNRESVFVSVCPLERC